MTNVTRRADFQTPADRAAAGRERPTDRAGTIGRGRCFRGRLARGAARPFAMRKTALALTVPGLLATAAFARLGETEAELVRRFGAPSSRAAERIAAQGKFHEIGSQLRFRDGDWRIESAIIDGRSARETYTKVGEWTEEQFLTVLASNAQGGKWTLASKDSMKKAVREWRRSDGATAVWRVGTLVVTHPAFDRAKSLAEAKAKAAAARTPNL